MIANLNSKFGEINYFCRQGRDYLRRRGRLHQLSQGQEQLRHVLHVRRQAQASHAVSSELSVQSQRERLRLARERRRLWECIHAQSGVDAEPEERQTPDTQTHSSPNVDIITLTLWYRLSYIIIFLWKWDTIALEFACICNSRYTATLSTTTQNDARCRRTRIFYQHEQQDLYLLLYRSNN